MKRILYIQHATSLGGSAISLLNLLRQLDRQRYEPVVACVGTGDAIPSFYREHGVEAFACPDLGIFPHTTGGWFPLYNPRALLHLCLAWARFNSVARAMERLVARVHPDLVHLNSVVLGPCAVGAARTGVPMVWHVREAVVHGHFGLRRRIIRNWLTRLPDEIIFISGDERRQLLGDLRGVVIPNGVDFQRFDRKLDRHAMRQELGLAPDAQVVLFLGGFWSIKGTQPFLKALHIEHQRNPRVHAVVAGALATPSKRLVARIGRFILPLIGRPTDRQWATRFMRQHTMETYVHLLPFRDDVERLLAASDVLLFPSTAPHFARPVIEAGAMARPVVASRLGGVEELVADGETGLLVTPNDVQALADALHQVLTQPEAASRMGENGFRRAQALYNADRNAAQVMELYDRVLAAPANRRRLPGSVDVAAGV